VLSAGNPGRAFVSRVVGRELVRSVVPALTSAGIAVMPLKGVWLQARVYRSSRDRVITDVDLLVPEQDYARALALLAQRGWHSQASNVSETSLSHPDFALPIDLHQRLFTRGAFRLATAGVFERACRDESSFGIELHMPDPLDAFAHLVGHFVKSRARLDDAMRLDDFKTVAEVCALDARACAQRLHAVGMARAARYALHGLAVTDESGFFAEVLRSLPVDRFGEGAASLALRIAERGEGTRLLGALPGFLLDRSVAAGGMALALRLLDRAREA
jgi:hypothetical protein